MTEKAAVVAPAERGIDTAEERAFVLKAVYLEEIKSKKTYKHGSVNPQSVKEPVYIAFEQA